MSWGGAARGRRASVLEFCLVFCTVSGLAQSSLWSRDFALDSLSYLAPTVRLWTRGAGTDRRPAAPARVPVRVAAVEARGLAPFPSGKVRSVFVPSWAGGGGEAAQGPWAWP